MASSSSARDPDRAKVHLNLAQDAIKKQVLQQQEEIRRLQDALVTKKDIIDDCQELLSGPLRSVFVTGGGPVPGVSSTLSHSETELQLYKRVRDRRRKKILDRLVPIVGDTVARSFQDGVNESTDTDKDTAPLDIWDCTAGWITSKSRTILWLGANCRNKSTATLRNISLSIALQETDGAVISSLPPQESCRVVCLLQVDLMSLPDEEYTNQDQTLRRILSNCVLVHYTPDQIGDNIGDTEEQVSPESVAISISDISVEAQVPSRWFHDLVNIALPAQYTCRMNGATRQVLGQILQDELLLSHEKGTGNFGSIQEEILVVIDVLVGNNPQEESRSLRVEFFAPTEALAIAAARRARLLCPRLY